MKTEHKRWINVRITGHKVVSIYAYTFWHAIELAHTKYMHLEPNRDKYIIRNSQAPYTRRVPFN